MIPDIFGSRVFFTQFWPRGGPDISLLRLHWRLSVFQTKITRFVGNSRTNREKHIEGIFFKPTQNHARIPGYFGFASAKRKICHFSFFFGFLSHFWIWWRVELHGLLAWLTQKSGKRSLAHTRGASQHQEPAAMHRLLELPDELFHQGLPLVLLQSLSQQPFSLLNCLLHCDLLHLLIMSLPRTKRR